eukprot:TRINITY_DN11729_c0_g2_i1.p1 TRINITY_DN11729_c0_g2~~TRINITY_DN11729_c0_g2_i1.p1  ORF type:complete len:230 (+),score=69.70 TRINITY_DN11729_c0_g2_i1:90-779(+)
MGCAGSTQQGAAQQPEVKQKEVRVETPQAKETAAPIGNTYKGATLKNKPTCDQTQAMLREYRRQQRREDSDEFDIVVATLGELAIDVYISRVLACCVYLRHNLATNTGETLWETILADFDHFFPMEFPRQHDQARYVCETIAMGEVLIRTDHTSSYASCDTFSRRLINKFCAPFDPSGGVAKELWTSMSKNDIITADSVEQDYELFCSFFATRRRTEYWGSEHNKARTR